jgi:hypothetical protein
MKTPSLLEAGTAQATQESGELSLIRNMMISPLRQH